VLKTDFAQQVMKRRPNLLTIFYRALQAAQDMKIPLWKVLPGLLTQFDKMFMISQFGAATKSIMAATVDGNMDEGVQFVGQSQGMINDIASVEEIIQRIVGDARTITLERAQRLA
jgi:enoyl-[acyl-carrier protein] reductase II